MRFAAPLIAVACVIGAAEDVLITGFKPFAGRPTNGSATMATWLGRELGSSVHVEVMPCTWDQPDGLISRVVQGRHWRALIGLGEGWPGLINVEQLARNCREHADEAKAEPPGREIEPGASDLRRGLRLESAWFDTLPTVSAQNEGLYGLAGVLLSSNAGTYLCNHVFYRFAQRRDVPVAGFIHLPVQGELGDAEYITRFGPTVRIIVERNLASAPR